ncbi:hypothetical protein IT408_00580 [Candidatus Uhrbacteria bacterium]|nr:hypothetical protein [Candidatus Uhrbacteria bacterium]
MEKTTYMLCKIKPGKRQVWLDWCKEMMEKHYTEASETLVEEDLVRERNFIFGEGDDSYVLYLHTPVEGKVKKPFNPTRELNQEHFRKFHECLEKVKPCVPGYDVSA